MPEPPRAPSPIDDPTVQAAVRELFHASLGFRDAYETVARAGDPTLFRSTLRDAERRLDEARLKVHDAELVSRMRVPVRRHDGP